MFMYLELLCVCVCCEEYVLHNDDDYELYGGNNVPLANENTRSNLTTEY